MDIKQKIVLFLVLLIGIAGILGLIFYGRGIRQVKETKEETAKTAMQEETAADASNILNIDIPEEVYYYTGTIAEIGDNQFILRAMSKDNYLVKDRDFTVLVAGGTEFEKYTRQIYLKPGQSPKDFVNKEAVTLVDFKVGDKVTVYSNKNIRGVLEFTASQVKMVETTD